MSCKCHCRDKSSDKLKSVEGCVSYSLDAKKGDVSYKLALCICCLYYIVAKWSETFSLSCENHETQELTWILIVQCEIHTILISANKTRGWEGSKRRLLSTQWKKNISILSTKKKYFENTVFYKFCKFIYCFIICFVGCVLLFHDSPFSHKICYYAHSLHLKD